MADLSWGGYRNGEIPLSAMTMVRNELFRSDAAEQLLLFEAGFKGEFGEEFRIGEGYRSYTRQQALSLAYQAYLRGGPWAPIAATPRTSKHGWGVAGDFWSRIDVFGTAEHEWAVKNGPRWGWIWGSTPSEAWHFEFPHAFGSFASTVVIPISNTTPFSMPKADTERLQKNLNRLGATLDVDGVYGKGVTAAVKTYQKANGLTDDGIAGVNTLKSIDAAIAALDKKEAAAAAAAKLARESIKMFDLFMDTEKNQSGHLGTPLGSLPLPKQTFDLFARRIKAAREGTIETFNATEIMLMDNALEAIIKKALG